MTVWYVDSEFRQFTNCAIWKVSKLGHLYHRLKLFEVILGMFFTIILKPYHYSSLSALEFSKDGARLVIRNRYCVINFGFLKLCNSWRFCPYIAHATVWIYLAVVINAPGKTFERLTLEMSQLLYFRRLF